MGRRRMRNSDGYLGSGEEMSNTLEGINQTSNTNFLFIKDNVPATINIEPFVQLELEPYRPGITTVFTISNQD